MNDDAISAAARAALIDMYLDLKVQLERGTGTRPMIWLLASSRNKAVDAIRQMIEIDATETAAIRALQAEVRLYGDMMESAREMLGRGREADGEVNEEDRVALADYLTSDEARESGITQTED
jgi:hypothetical protein